MSHQTHLINPNLLFLISEIYGVCIRAQKLEVVESVLVFPLLLGFQKSNLGGQTVWQVLDGPMFY